MDLSHPLFKLLLQSRANLVHALVRFIVVAIVLLYTLAQLSENRASDIGMIVAAFALVLSLHLLVAPPSNHPARVGLEFVFDHSAPYWALWQFGPSAMPLMVCAFAACIAYGYRFGWRCTLYSAAASIGALLAATQTSDAWAAHMPWLVVFCGSLLVVAVCLPVLLGHLQAARRDLARRTEGEALYDDLTGLGSTALLRERMRNALRQAQRYGNGVGVLVFDLDGFGRINERLGREGGDALLREVARRVEANIRGTDLLCREGSDEFVLLVERLASGAGCERVAEVVLREIKSIERASQAGYVSDAPGAGETRIALTASVGISVYRPELEDAGAQLDSHINHAAERLVSEASAAMVRAKLQGKGRWCVAGAESSQVDALRAPGHLARG